MTLPPNKDSAHFEFLDALYEFYTILVQLAILSPEDLILPDANTGRHQDQHINAAAASAAGYTPEAIDLMYQMPYVVDKKRRNEFIYSSMLMSYWGEKRNEGYFLTYRDSLDGNMVPGWSVCITLSGSNGIMIYYDLKQKKMIPWEILGAYDSYDQTPPLPIREVLGDYIEKYRTFYYLYLHDSPFWVDHNPEFYSEGQPPKDWSTEEKDFWLRGFEAWQASRKQVDFYLECGWDQHSREQPNIRNKEFVQRRQNLFDEVVTPLRHRQLG